MLRELADPLTPWLIEGAAILDVGQDDLDGKHLALARTCFLKVRIKHGEALSAWAMKSGWPSEEFEIVQTIPLKETVLLLPGAPAGQ